MSSRINKTILFEFDNTFNMLCMMANAVMAKISPNEFNEQFAKVRIKFMQTHPFTAYFP